MRIAIFLAVALVIVAVALLTLPAHEGAVEPAAAPLVGSFAVPVPTAPVPAGAYACPGVYAP